MKRHIIFLGQKGQFIWPPDQNGRWIKKEAEMHLFVFRRVYNPEARYREEPEYDTVWPLIYAIHPTRKNISAKKWKEIIERVGKKDNEYFPKFLKISEQVDEQLQKEGLKPSDDKHFARLVQLTEELGGVPGFAFKALEEVLTEEGFIVLKPKEFIYQLPLRDYDRRKNAEMAAFNERVHGKRTK